MKNKSLNLSVLSVFVMLFLVSFASAQIELNASDTSFAQVDGSTLAINVTGVTGNVTFNISSVKDEANKVINFTTSPSPFISNGTLTITSDIPTDFHFLDLANFTLTATEINATNGTIIGVARTMSLSFEKTSFCYFENNNPDRVNDNDDLAVEIDDIQVINGFGEDDEWFLFDEIEVEVNIDNKNDENIDNIVLEWGLYDPAAGEWVIELTEEDDFDLKDGDEETLVFSFKLDDDLDMDISSLSDGKLLLYVRASGEDDNNDNTCNTADTEEVSLVIDDDFVKVDNIKMLDSVSCGTEIPITAEVWNIGSDDQDDVYITIFNRELGINQEIDVGDIDEFEREKISAYITIPKDASEKSYTLLFSVYDEDGDIFENSNDDVSETIYEFQVSGGCSTLAPVEVKAELTSETKAGQEVTIKVTVENLDNLKRTFKLELEGYSNWASSANLDKSTVEIAAGASQEVIITIIPNEDAEGQKAFNLIVTQDKKTLSQSIQLTVESSKELGANVFSNVKDFLESKVGNNWYLWAIAIFNIILIAAIIIIAVKMSRKKSN